MNRRWPWLGAAMGVVTAAATAGLAGPAYFLHDTVARFSARPQLPVMVVTIDEAPSAATEYARQAGARTVQMALPPGHSLLGDAPSEAVGLEAGADGRIRAADGRRLRVPEALPSLRRMHESQLRDLGIHQPLTGMDVVLVYATEGLGRAVLLPGQRQPVDRGVALAIAQGSTSASIWLHTLPLWLASTLTGLMALLLTQQANRVNPTRAWAWTLGVSLAVLLVAVGLRSLGVDVPVGGMLLAAALPGPIRLLTASNRTMEVLDGLSLRIGGLYRWTDENVGPIEGLPTLLSMSFPGVSVAVFRGKAGEAPQRLSYAGPDLGASPLERLPANAVGTPLRHEEPIYEQGRLMGALVLQHPSALPTGAVDLARVAARRAAWQYGIEDNGTQDPVNVRLNVLRRGVLHTVKTVTAWQALLSGGELPIGIFDRCGDLVAGNRPLRACLGQTKESPLVSVLRELLVDEDAVKQALGQVQQAPQTLTLPCKQASHHLRLSPLFSSEGPAGVLLQAEMRPMTTPSVPSEA